MNGCRQIIYIAVLAAILSSFCISCKAATAIPDECSYAFAQNNMTFNFTITQSAINGPVRNDETIKYRPEKNEVINPVEPGDEFEDIISIKVEDIFDCNRKVAFLTFDDGPSKNITPLVIDILDEYDIKATFFVLGSLCRENSAVLKDAFDKGHSIGIHTYTHEYGRIFKDEESFMGEIEMTVEILKNCLGDNFETRLFRFPGGCFEDYKRKYIGILNEKGYVYIDWNTLTGDSESLNPKPEHLMERFKETSEGKDQLIVLMHDSSAKGATVKVLPDVIEYLKSQGYEFAVLK
jgi:peptidoglycan/xylan/chitin deacetylase (PgdA/CDA1 family)